MIDRTVYRECLYRNGWVYRPNSEFIVKPVLELNRLDQRIKELEANRLCRCADAVRCDMALRIEELERSLYQAMLAAAPKPDAELARECEWRGGTDYDATVWYGACGLMWEFTNDGPVENEFHYCPRCGGKVRIKEENHE